MIPFESYSCRGAWFDSDVQGCRSRRGCALDRGSHDPRALQGAIVEAGEVASRQLQRRDKTIRARLSARGGVIGDAVVGRGADVGQAECDVHAAPHVERLHRDQPTGRGTWRSRHPSVRTCRHGRALRGRWCRRGARR